MIYSKLQILCKHVFKSVLRAIYPTAYKLTFLANDFGFSRGKPFDRYYIEDFLSMNRNLIYGKCLEFGDTVYTLAYGRSVSRATPFYYSDTPLILETAYYGDICHANSFPPSTFDCIICTNVLNYILNAQEALVGMKKILSDSGSIIVTVAGPSTQISRYDMDRWGDFWRFTERSFLFLVENAGLSANSIKIYGNPYAAVHQILGGSVEDQPDICFADHHPDYPMIIAMVLTKNQ